MLATTEEGVHCIGYDELVSLGLSPADVNPSELRLFGWGGGARLSTTMWSGRWMFRNEVATRAWTMDRLTLATSCVGMPLITWAGVGMRRTVGPTSSFWGDTAKWFLRVDALMSLERADMEDAQVGMGRWTTSGPPMCTAGSMKNTKSTSSAPVGIGLQAIDGLGLHHRLLEHISNAVIGDTATLRLLAYENDGR